MKRKKCVFINMCLNNVSYHAKHCIWISEEYSNLTLIWEFLPFQKKSVLLHFKQQVWYTIVLPFFKIVVDKQKLLKENCPYKSMHHLKVQMKLLWGLFFFFSLRLFLKTQKLSLEIQWSQSSKWNRDIIKYKLNLFTNNNVSLP